MLTKPQMAKRDDGLKELQAFIDAGGFSAGDRLPAERELIEQLGVSRNVLRKGLDALERQGVIWRHVGKGTFIGDKVHAAHSSEHRDIGLAEISHQVTPVQMMRARLALEPALAREAAANASNEVVIRLRAARDRAVAATSWDTYETNDDAFHCAIAEATGNIMLQSLFDHLNQVRRGVVWKQVVRKSDKPPKNHSSFAEHDLIFTAIEARDPARAHTAMREHLSSVTARLFGDD